MSCSVGNVKKWQTRYPTLHAAIEKTIPLVTMLRMHPDAELEARFGTVANTVFQAGVSRKMIDHIIEMMQSSSYLTGGEWNEEQDFIFIDPVTASSSRSRVQYCSHTMTVSTETVQKKLLGNKTFGVFPENAEKSEAAQAIRVSLKEEKAVQTTAPCVQTTLVRIKQRRRFTTVDKMWAFDFAVTWSGETKTIAEHNQANNDPVFEIECELINPAEALAIYDDAHIATSLLLKMQQLLPHELRTTIMSHIS
jgi:hypothetical protein